MHEPKKITVQFPIDRLPNLIERCKLAASCIQNVNTTKPSEANDECSICCGKLSDEAPVTHAGCGHPHHYSCLSMWFKHNHQQRVCPVCRYEFSPVVSDSPCFRCSVLNQHGSGHLVKMRCCTATLHLEHQLSFMERRPNCLVCFTELQGPPPQWAVIDDEI